MVATVAECPQSLKLAVNCDSFGGGQTLCWSSCANILGHLDNYEREGLWTLVVASTELTQREASLLTGDKQETAIIIGFSHLLLEWDMHQIINNENTRVGCEEAIMKAKGMHEIMSTQKERRFSFTRHNSLGGNSLTSEEISNGTTMSSAESNEVFNMQCYKCRLKNGGRFSC